MADGVTEQGISIQAAADRTGLSPHTLRYYERIGLINEVRRGSDGRRRYDSSDLAWLGFLTKLRTTGMPIKDMVRYVELVREGDSTAGARREMLEAHRVRVVQHIAALQQDLKVLDRKIDNYARIEACETTTTGPRRPTDFGDRARLHGDVTGVRTG